MRSQNIISPRIKGMAYLKMCTLQNKPPNLVFRFEIPNRKSQYYSEKTIQFEKPQLAFAIQPYFQNPLTELKSESAIFFESICIFSDTVGWFGFSILYYNNRFRATSAVGVERVNFNLFSRQRLFIIGKCCCSIAMKCNIIKFRLKAEAFWLTMTAT